MLASPHCLLAALLLAAPSQPQSPPPLLVAAHPLVLVESGPADQEELQAIFAVELVRAGVPLVESSPVREFLAQDPQGSCASKELCLVALARHTRASHALLVTLAPPTLVLSATVVGADGKLVRSVAPRPFPKQSGLSRPEQIRQALRALLAELDLPHLPPISQNQSIPAEPAEPAPPVPGGGRDGQGLRIGAYAAGGTAVALGILSVVSFSSAASDASRLSTLTREGRLPAEGTVEHEQALALNRSIGAKNVTGVASAIGAGALGAAAVALYLLAPSEDLAVAGAVGRDGGAIVVRIPLP